MCVLQLLCDGSKIATILNEFSQKLERFVVACLRPQAKLSISDGREIRPKSVRHAADAK